MGWTWTNYLLWVNRCARAELERRTTDAQEKRMLALLQGQYAALAMWDPKQLADDMEEAQLDVDAARARAEEISAAVKQGHKVWEVMH